MNHPHIQVEWDPQYRGGNYSRVGRVCYIPLTDLDSLDVETVEAAFEKLEGVSRRHIIHYSTDELYTADGDCYEEDDVEL